MAEKDWCDLESWGNSGKTAAFGKPELDYRPEYSSDIRLGDYMPGGTDKPASKYILERKVSVNRQSLRLIPTSGWSSRMHRVMSHLNFKVAPEKHPETNKCYLTAIANTDARQEYFVETASKIIVLSRWDIIAVYDEALKEDVFIGYLYFDEIEIESGSTSSPRQYKTSWRWRN
ncbi:MAG: hypothetical protein ACI9SP_000879 [Arenicella sp.]|jgi:hypothetical protein